MAILGVIVRGLPEGAPALAGRLSALPGLELAETTAAADGRLVVVIEDTATTTAAATLGAIATWPEVLNVSLVYEYSGPDSPAPDDVEGFRDWRRSLVPGTPRS
jgi:nitrate reductase NapAB chaperone NapD